jgi:diguanylate cyclase (GGDEF)-like protein
MAASDTHTSDQLVDRIEEEIARAERAQAPLSCLLVDIANLSAIEQTHGERFAEQTLAYVGLLLRRELRRYDRVGATGKHAYLVVLPGADGPRGEIVARRALARLHAVKIETGDGRRSLPLAVGIATWRAGTDAQELIAQAQTTTGCKAPEESYASPPLPSRPLGFKDALWL